MKTLIVSLLGFAFLLGAAAQAEMYRWVDKDGKVHYTDQPPPPNEAKKVEEKKFGGNLIQGDLPYATQQAAKNFPVTLYTGDCGEFCTQAKTYLSKRGIPYSERLPGKNPADAELFKKISKDNFIPLLQIGGSTQLRGFDESAWAAALDQAGYPKSNPFPRGQQPKPAEPGKAETPPAANTPASPKPEDGGGRKSY
ncbi:MAG: glutaredoxin family protein [Hydrogenophilales bacterium]|nr:glutaredoxin family protein [Hydrogenophilales bacterium]